jgi:hypothetical protein
MQFSSSIPFLEFVKMQLSFWQFIINLKVRVVLKSQAGVCMDVNQKPTSEGADLQSII